MGQKKQYQLKLKQQARRKQRRKQLAAKGEKLENYFYGKYYIKLGSS